MSKFLEMALAAYVSVTTPRKDDEKGATAVEYGLMVALIAVFIIASVTLLGTELAAAFNYIAGEIGAVVP